MSYLFLLDGVVYDPPTNWDDLNTTIKRGSNLDGFLVTQDATFTFIQDAYTLLYNKFWDEGFCTEVEIDILDECEDGMIHEVYTGIIKIADLIFDDDKCSVQAKVEDNSFYAYINNNKNIDISPTANGTKNGIEITPPTIWELDAFNPNVGVHPLTYSYRGYRVYDLLEHAIMVMTDSKVGFTSDFLWNQDEELFLTTGFALRDAGEFPLFVYTFEKLYSELNKQFNLAFYIEQDMYSIPTLRIEPKDYFYSTAPGFTFEDLKDLKISADKTKLYGTVLLGSTILDDADALFDFDEDVPFYGFKQEKFYPLGQCNMDIELNLVNDYVISSNVIQDCIVEFSEAFDNDLIFVTCEDLNVATNQAIMKAFILGAVAPPYIFNLNLNNYNKAQRHFGFLPGNLLDAFNVSSRNFHAETATDTIYNAGVGSGVTDVQLAFVTSGSTVNFNYWDYNSVFSPYPFPDESSPGNYDLGGNYDNTTYQYTIPVDGRYTFNTKIFYNIIRSFTVNQSGTNLVRNMYVRINRYDSGLTFIENNSVTNIIPIPIGNYEAMGSAAFDCVAGDIIRVSIEIYVRLWQDIIPIGGIRKFGLQITGASYFESTSDNVIVGAAPGNYKIIKYEFTLPVTPSDFRSILADPTGLQTFTKWNEIRQIFIERRAWIDEIKYNNQQGLATIRLVTNYAITDEN